MNNIEVQSKLHPIARTGEFRTQEDYVLHLIHLRAYQQAIPLVAGRSVLDWGCNCGYGIEVLCAAASHVVGLDISPKALEAARTRFSADQVEFIHYDGLAAPHIDPPVDVVTSFQVIEHAEDTASYVRALQQVMHPRGTTLITTPNAKLRLESDLAPWNPFHVREFTATQLESILRRFYAHVFIMGLFGSPALTAIEKRRIAARRAIGRKYGGVIPIEKLCSDETNEMMPNIPYRPSEFNFSSLYYLSTNPDDALDFMAICVGPR